jgi:hypothetical protein
MVNVEGVTVSDPASLKKALYNNTRRKWIHMVRDRISTKDKIPAPRGGVAWGIWSDIKLNHSRITKGYLNTRSTYSDKDIKTIMGAQADRWWTNVFGSITTSSEKSRKCRHCKKRNETAAHILTMTSKDHPDAITALVRTRHNEGLASLAKFINSDCDQWKILSIDGKNMTTHTHQIITDYRRANKRPDMILSRIGTNKLLVLDVSYAQDRGLIQEDEWEGSTNKIGPHWDRWDKKGILIDQTKIAPTTSSSTTNHEEPAGYHPSSGKRQISKTPPHISTRARYYHRYAEIAKKHKAQLGVIAIGVCGWAPNLTRQTLWKLTEDNMPANALHLKQNSPDTLLREMVDVAIKHIPLIYRKWKNTSNRAR